MDIVKLMACLFGLVWSSGSFGGATQYLCVVDKMTGFSYDKSTNQWKEANFKADKNFLITRSTNPKISYEIKEVGSEISTSWCDEDFNESGNLFCRGFGEYRFNKDHLRFLYIYPIGYWDDDNKSDLFKEGDNTPALGIGKCSPF